MTRHDTTQHVLISIYFPYQDHVGNPDEFPKRFTEGVWEGFWWAVVTMTTVG
jgi:hypothetical protein